MVGITSPQRYQIRTVVGFGGSGVIRWPSHMAHSDVAISLVSAIAHFVSLLFCTIANDPGAWVPFPRVSASVCGGNAVTACNALTLAGNDKFGIEMRATIRTNYASRSVALLFEFCERSSADKI
jgi:hypothetical protein